MRPVLRVESPALSPVEIPSSPLYQSSCVSGSEVHLPASARGLTSLSPIASSASGTVAESPSAPSSTTGCSLSFVDSSACSPGVPSVPSVAEPSSTGSSPASTGCSVAADSSVDSVPFPTGSVATLSAPSVAPASSASTPLGIANSMVMASAITMHRYSATCATTGRVSACAVASATSLRKLPPPVRFSDNPLVVSFTDLSNTVAPFGRASWSLLLQLCPFSTFLRGVYLIVATCQKPVPHG